MKFLTFDQIKAQLRLDDQQADDERDLLEVIEHRRWNAYMRSKGFRYASQKDMAIKTHYDLVPWKDLPLRERYKD